MGALGPQPEQEGPGREHECRNWKPRENCLLCSTLICIVHARSWDKKKISKVGAEEVLKSKAISSLELFGPTLQENKLSERQLEEAEANPL